MKVLFVSPYYPSPGRPYVSPFVKRTYDALAQQVDMELFTFEAKRKLINYIKARKRLKRLLKENSYDLIHIQWGHTISIVPFFLRIPLVVSFRGSDVHGVLNSQGKRNWISSLVQWVSRYAAWRSDYAVFVSNRLKEIVQPSGPSGVVPTGIDLSTLPEAGRLELRSKLNWKQEDTIVLFVGNPKNVGKQFAVAQQAVNRLMDQHPNLRFEAVWKRSPAEVLECMKAADFLLQTSLQEGSPNIVKEALANNLRIITTPVGDVEERLAGLDQCYITKGFHLEEIVNSLQSALAKYRPLKENVFSSVLADVSLDKEVRSLQAIYKKLTA